MRTGLMRLRCGVMRLCRHGHARAAAQRQQKHEKDHRKKTHIVIINAAYLFQLGWRQNPCYGSTQTVRGMYRLPACFGFQSLPCLVQPQLQAVKQIMAAEGAAFFGKERAGFEPVEQLHQDLFKALRQSISQCLLALCNGRKSGCIQAFNSQLRQGALQLLAQRSSEVNVRFWQVCWHGWHGRKLVGAQAAACAGEGTRLRSKASVRSARMPKGKPTQARCAKPTWLSRLPLTMLPRAVPR